MLNIEDPNARALASQISALTGESIADVVLHSRETEAERYRNTLEWLASLPKESVADHRTADEIVGYDERGLPH